MPDKPLDTEKRFDKIDQQLLKMNQQFVKMNQQLDKIATVVVKGFDRIDKALDEKASKEDMQRALGLLDALANAKRFPTTNA